jgi:glycosyltransferase involved in cell wall biosynthesis
MLRKHNSSLKFLSIIVPAYKQENTIVKDIKRIDEELVKMKNKYEIIVVVDGMVDNTYKELQTVKSRKIKIIAYERNEGKGHAIQYGMFHAKGDVIGFLDAGMDLDPKGLAILLADFQKYNADIVIGSKRHQFSHVTYPFKRRVVSYLSQKFIKLLFGLDVTDTQVGMKFFKRSVIKKVLPRLLVKKFAFDVEILSVAYYLGFKKIYEAPVDLNYNFKGSIISQNMITALYHTFWDTCAIFYRLRIIHYYDHKKAFRPKSLPNLKVSMS